MPIQDVQADHAGSHLGKAAGVVSLLQAIPEQLPKRQFSLPSQLMAKHNVSTEQAFKDPACLKEIVFDVASGAYSQYLAAKQIKLPKDAWMALAPCAVPTKCYLDLLQLCDFNLFDSRLQQRNWRVFPVLWKTYRASAIQ